VVTSPPDAAVARPTPCWKTLFVDYADGRIDATYTIGCYRAVLAHLGKDPSVYGSAEADVSRVLTAFVTRMGTENRVEIAPTTKVPASAGSARTGARASSSSTSGWVDALRIAFAGALVALLAAWIAVRLRAHK
jgi:hypothetical protein